MRHRGPKYQATIVKIITVRVSTSIRSGRVGRLTGCEMGTAASCSKNVCLTKIIRVLRMVVKQMFRIIRVLKVEIYRK